MTITIEALSQEINGQVIGNKEVIIHGVTNSSYPIDGLITFISSPDQLEMLEKSDISAIIVPKMITTSSKPLIACENPKLGFALALQHFHPPLQSTGTLSQSASIAKSATLGENVTIESFATIGENVKIGKNTIIRSGVYLDENVEVGENCLLYPHVVIYKDCKLGNHVMLHANSVIGADGFGFVHSGTEQVKVPQIGNVILEDNVEIGAGTTVDRATMGSTIIRKGVKIDNQVQIAHNVEIGENTVLSSFVGVSGSTKIGSNCTIGGQVGIGDHCKIGNQVMIGAQSGLPSKKKVPDGQILLGSPARPIQSTKKSLAAQSLLPSMLKKFSVLEKKIETYEKMAEAFTEKKE